MKLEITADTVVNARGENVEMRKVRLSAVEAYLGCDDADRAWMREELANFRTCKFDPTDPITIVEVA